MNQLCHRSDGICIRVFRSGQAGANRLSGIHRFLIHRKVSIVGVSLFRICVTCARISRFAAVRMAENTMIRIGQVSSSGRQLLIGLTPSFLYSSAVFWFSFSLSLAYFFCSSASLG